MIGPGDDGYPAQLYQRTRFAVFACALAIAVEDAEARFKRLQQRCAALGVESLHDAEIDAWCGAGAAYALERSRLGKRLDDGNLQIAGVAELMRAHGRRKLGNVRGGKTRALVALRDRAGRFKVGTRSQSRSTVSGPKRALRKILGFDKE